MKFYAFLLLIALYGASAYGQTIALTNESQNIVIVGIDNPMTIAVDGYSCKSLIVSTNNGTISRYDNGSFLLKPDHNGEALITVKAKTSKGIKELGVKPFGAKCPPAPTFYLLDKSRGTMSAKLIHAAVAPGARETNFGYELKYMATDFTVVVIRSDKEIFNKQLHNAKGARFSDDDATQKMIETLQPNDQLIIKDIVYKKVFGNCLSEVNTINLTITE